MEQASFNCCIECDEVITNPICTECLAASMRISISEKSPHLARQIQGFQLAGNTQCIFCRKQMAICAHCFSKDIYHYLEEKNPHIAKEFASRFDFDLRRYIAEMA